MGPLERSGRILGKIFTILEPRPTVINTRTILEVNVLNSTTAVI
jgi:hypothetical protein